MTTIAQAAAMLGKSKVHIRNIVCELDLGQKVLCTTGKNTFWHTILSAADIEVLRRRVMLPRSVDAKADPTPEELAERAALIKAKGLARLAKSDPQIPIQEGGRVIKTMWRNGAIGLV